jgi:hypothetical protein
VLEIWDLHREISRHETDGQEEYAELGKQRRGSRQARRGLSIFLGVDVEVLILGSAGGRWDKFELGYSYCGYQSLFLRKEFLGGVQDHKLDPVAEPLETKNGGLGKNNPPRVLQETGLAERA